MKPANFFLFAILIAFTNEDEDIVPIILFSQNDSMTFNDYQSRSNYLDFVKNYLNYNIVNDTPSGPFNFHLKFPFPINQTNVYSVNASAVCIFQDCIDDLSNSSYICNNNVNSSIQVQLFNNNNANNEFDIYFLIDIQAIDSHYSYFSRYVENNTVIYGTTIEYFFNTTESNNINYPVLKLLFPVIFSRPYNVTGSFSSININPLESEYRPLYINSSIRAKLTPCIDEDPQDLNTCSMSMNPPPYLYNSYGKFYLWLEGSSLLSNYYLFIERVTLSNNDNGFKLDCTSGVRKTNSVKGLITLNIQMVLVGNISITVVASLKPNTRLLEGNSPSSLTQAAMEISVLESIACEFFIFKSFFLMFIILMIMF